MDRYYDESRRANLGENPHTWPLEDLQQERARLFREVRRLYSGPAMVAASARYTVVAAALKAARGERALVHDGANDGETTCHACGAARDYLPCEACGAA